MATGSPCPSAAGHQAWQRGGPRKAGTVLKADLGAELPGSRRGPRTGAELRKQACRGPSSLRRWAGDPSHADAWVPAWPGEASSPGAQPGLRLSPLLRALGVMLRRAHRQVAPEGGDSEGGGPLAWGHSATARPFPLPRGLGGWALPSPGPRAPLSRGLPGAVVLKAGPRRQK